MKHAIFLLVILAMAAEELSAGINVWTSHGPGGGNIQALAIDPKNPGTVYAAASSQVFKSTDGGANWNSARSGLKAGSISALTIDSQNPGTVYALGGALFKSTDGAQNWNVVNLLPPVSALALDPRNPGTLYAGAAAGGVFKSTDGGNSWIPASSGLPGGAVYDLVVDPQNPKTVYAGVGYPGGIFKTTDGGATWNAPLKLRLVELDKSPTDTCDNWGYYFSQVMGHDAPAPEDIRCLAPDGSRDQLITADQYVADLQHKLNFGVLASFTSFSSLVVDPQNSSALYAATFLGVSKSTDGGVSWSAGETFGRPANTDSGPGALAVDPKNPGTVYATAYHCDPTGCGLQVYKSVDGAVSWNAIGSGLLTKGSTGYAVAVVIDLQNPSTLYAGTGAGLFKSTDGAASWSPMNAGLAATSIGALAVDPQDRGTLFASPSCCGIAAVFKSTDAGTSWASIGLPAADSVSAFTVDPQNPATMYAGICCAHQLNDPHPGLFKSMDGGTSWFKTGLAQPPGRLIIDPQNPGTLYAQVWVAGAGILKSMDGGATWNPASSGLPALDSSGSGFLTLDPQSPNTLYVYASRSSFDSGQIFRTTDGAGSWSAINLGWDPGLFDLGFLVADPQSSGTLYAGTQPLDCSWDLCPPDYWTKLQATSGAGLFKSTDGGNNWVKLDWPSGLVTFDPKNPNTLYAATYLGVSKSTDGGVSWNVVGSGLTASVSAVVVDPQDSNTVYAATNGGGVFAITFASQ